MECLDCFREFLILGDCVDECLIRDEGLDIELLDLGQYNTHDERLKNIQHAITIIEYMDRNLADSTMGNYPRYFEEYYGTV